MNSVEEKSPFNSRVATWLSDHEDREAQCYNEVLLNRNHLAKARYATVSMDEQDEQDDPISKVAEARGYLHRRFVAV